MTVALADQSSIPEIQAMQDAAVAEYGHESVAAFFPRSEQYRRDVLEWGGELYIIRDQITSQIVASMIGLNVTDDIDFASAVNANIQAGGDLIVPGSRKIISAAIVRKSHLGQNLWRSMVQFAADITQRQGLRDISFASALSHDKICQRAIKMGFYITGVARHKVMDVKGVILSAGAQYITTPGNLDFVSYSKDQNIDVALETYLDGGFIGTGLDPARQIIGIAQIDTASALVSNRNLSELIR